MRKLPLWLLLTLPVLATLACLWVAWLLVIEVEQGARERSGVELQLAADSMAALLVKDERFLREVTGDDQGSYLSEVLATSPVLDGRDDDWPQTNVETLGLAHLLEINSPYSTDTLSYQLRVGSDAESLYLHYKVVDDFVVYREINHPSVHRNDHVQIAFVDVGGLFKRYTLAVVQPGHIEAMEIGRNGRALRSEPAISGRWLATETGYNLEIQLPLSRLGDRFSTLVADVDDEKVRLIRHMVGRSHTREANLLGDLVSSPTPLQLLVDELPWPAVLYDAQRNIIAGTGADVAAGDLIARADIGTGEVRLGELTLSRSFSTVNANGDASRQMLLIVFGVAAVLVLVVMQMVRHGVQLRLQEAEREVGRVQQYNDYLERMASRLNHELQTPVSVIRSSIEHLQAQGAEDSVYVARASEGMERLTNILNKMAEARRLEEALDEDEITRFDLVELVSGCVAGYELAFPQVIFELNIEADEVPVTGIPELIAQGLDKLIDNAVEFSGSNTIRLRLNIEQGQALLRIFNEGATLPQGSVDTLFESMVSVREKSGETHLGLGLYVARMITEYHGGQLSLSNREDIEGVVATVRLPILRLTSKLS